MEATKSWSGNSATVNFALISLLRYMGLEAWPLLISTRSNGPIFKDFPLVYQFNHAICHVKVNGKEYILDATVGFPVKWTV